MTAPQQLRTSAGEYVISVRALQKSYGSLEAVRGIDLDVAKGEIFGLIGPDGAGKRAPVKWKFMVAPHVMRVR
jgi:ABC-type uncharacterized transport system ATPase subunit